MHNRHNSYAHGTGSYLVYLDYDQLDHIKKSREKNISKVSVSYTRNDANNKQMALEIKLDKRKSSKQQKLEDFREKHNASRQRLHEYIDQMFEKEQREKEKMQKYLHQK